ncbi:hypothetical protein JMUB6875_11370 [Nocardia sp. JMUB6875]
MAAVRVATVRGVRVVPGVRGMVGVIAVRGMHHVGGVRGMIGVGRMLGVGSVVTVSSVVVMSGVGLGGHFCVLSTAFGALRMTKLIPPRGICKRSRSELGHYWLPGFGSR